MWRREMSLRQQNIPSLASLVDLGKETLKDLLPHPFAFVDARNHFLDFADAALFVVAVNAGQVQFAEQFFHPGFGSVIFSSIVFIQQSPLLRGALQESLIDQPPTLIVLDVGPDFANYGGVAECIQV